MQDALSKQLEEMKKRPQPVVRTWEEGEIFWFLGRQYPLHFVDDETTAIVRTDRLCVPRTLTMDIRTAVRRWYMEEAAKEILEVKVRMLEGRTHPNKLDVSCQETLREFIDQHLYKLYGEKSDKLVLIHLGRQLPLDRTFKEEDIEDGA